MSGAPRITLRARPAHRAPVIGSSGISLAIGLALGIVATVFVTRPLEGNLFGVSRFDALAFAAVAALFAAAGVVASFVPARRAMKVDPMMTMKA